MIAIAQGGYVGHAQNVRCEGLGDAAFSTRYREGGGRRVCRRSPLDIRGNAVCGHAWIQRSTDDIGIVEGAVAITRLAQIANHLGLNVLDLRAPFFAVGSSRTDDWPGWLFHGSVNVAPLCSPRLFQIEQSVAPVICKRDRAGV